MARLRRDTHSDTHIPPQPKPLRIFASGTLFLTHTLLVPTHPGPNSVVRAHSVEKTRGGSASTLLSLLAQFPTVEASLIAPLGGNDEGQMILRDLDREGVITRYCKIWKTSGVPSAWVVHSSEGNTRTVINHNPVPDITHEDFVALLGPLLAPENFSALSPVLSQKAPAYGSTTSLPGTATPRPSQSGPPPALINPNSPAPFDWLHFEGRSVKTTLSNITGIDGLARERKWRSHCVFSIDVGRKGRQGIEALIPHADVIFVNRYYARASSPHYATTPRGFLLSLSSIAPPHALLVAHWGSEGAAVLSLPTKEYFQSSGWVEERVPPVPTTMPRMDSQAGNIPDVRSVRTGSDFWAGARTHTPSSSAFTAQYRSEMGEESHMGFSGSSYTGGPSSHTHSNSYSMDPHDEQLNYRDSNYTAEEDGDDNDSQGTEMPEGEHDDNIVLDEVGAQDAFIAGMIYALSRRIMPGSPYTPSWSGDDPDGGSGETQRGRWRLDECLRFATELAGRKARRRSWSGLADEMSSAGWFDN